MLETVAGIVAQLGVPGIFLLMFAENVFPPIPSEAIMPVAGFNAARGSCRWSRPTWPASRARCWEMPSGTRARGPWGRRGWRRSPTGTGATSA
ncbi:DedA family protein [Roseomonas sp. CCTCC AB2023176]|uniref:DedA family protein n=1 Tax=Roseomonas sp. CCTCC AB2023176 TaxID=3342640 RepID=UPI0035E0C0EA